MTERSSGYYARIMGTFWRHPRTSSLTLAARGLWVSLLSWCADQRSDGEIPAHVVQMVGAADKRVDAYRRELESVGLLTLPRAGVFQLRDWEQHNITRAEHDKAKDRAKNGMANKRATDRAVTPPVTRNSPVTNTPGSVQPSDQEQEQEHSRSTERESRGRAGALPPESPLSAPSLGNSLTLDSEVIRKAAERAFKAADRAAPPAVRDLAGKPWVALVPVLREVATRDRVSLEEVADRLMAGFLASPRAREKHYPIGFLAGNPAEYLGTRVEPQADLDRLLAGIPRGEVSETGGTVGDDFVFNDESKAKKGPKKP